MLCINYITKRNQMTTYHWCKKEEKPSLLHYLIDSFSTLQLNNHNIHCTFAKKPHQDCYNLP